MRFSLSSLSFPFFLLMALWFSSPALAQNLPQKSPAQPSDSTSAPNDVEGVSVEENVPYMLPVNPQWTLDVYKPAAPGKNRAAVVLIHGGGWIGLDKSTMRRMGMFLARSGFVAFSVNYRLFDGKENAWPTQLDDVQHAVRWIRANPEKYGVNPERIGAFGHSAGGQLAALLGMVEARDNSAADAKYSSKVQAVVDVSAPSDFTTEKDPDAIKFFTSFLGGDSAKHQEIWQQASPVFHVSRDNAPFLIIHGTQDQEVPIAQAQELYDKLQSAGASVSLIKVEDVHTFQTPEARRRLAIETVSFFNHKLVQDQ
jgi:acetyl esterase/lipase